MLLLIKKDLKKYYKFIFQKKSLKIQHKGLQYHNLHK
jgi:hypothetical protein